MEKNHYFGIFQLKHILFLFIIIIFNVDISLASTPIANQPIPACLEIADAIDFYSARIKKDTEGIAYLIKNNRCIYIKPGAKYSILDHVMLDRFFCKIRVYLRDGKAILLWAERYEITEGEITDEKREKRKKIRDRQVEEFQSALKRYPNRTQPTKTMTAEEAVESTRKDYNRILGIE